MKCLALFLTGLLLTASHVKSEPLEPSRFPSLISSVRITGPLTFCEESVPVNKQEVRERMEKELLLTLWDRPQVILWIKRSARYFPLIEKMLVQQKMPEDLKYVSVVESALRPHVGSPKGAMGFWQFMPATGRKYGLAVNPEMDERRNIFASTQGAIAYFKELYERFGSWTLAAAAFNMGEEGLASEILAQGTNRFYHLYLPLETQRYLFRALSAKLILSNPKKYGFRFIRKDLYPPLQYDRIRLNLAQEAPMLLIAQAAKTSFKTIKDLNPEIRGHHLAKGERSILIPKGATKDFHIRFEKIMAGWQANRKQRTYVVKKGENLSVIAERFNVPLPALLIWNQLKPTRPIHPGDRLIIAPHSDP